MAYETLCANPDLGVTDFITMGSPLTGELIHARLEPTPGPDGGAWPAGLTAWTNIRGANDPACAAPLAGQFVGGVQDKAVDNGHRVHDPEPYLNNPSAGAAIAAGLARG